METAVERLQRLVEASDEVALAGRFFVKAHSRVSEDGGTVHVDSYFRNPHSMGPRELIAAYEAVSKIIKKNRGSSLMRTRALNQRKQFERELKRRHILLPKPGRKYAPPGMDYMQAVKAGYTPLPRSTEDYEWGQNQNIPPSPLDLSDLDLIVHRSLAADAGDWERRDLIVAEQHRRQLLRERADLLQETWDKPKGDFRTALVDRLGGLQHPPPSRVAAA